MLSLLVAAVCTAPFQQGPGIRLTPLLPVYQGLPVTLEFTGGRAFEGVLVARAEGREFRADVKQGIREVLVKGITPAMLPEGVAFDLQEKSGGRLTSVLQTPPLSIGMMGDYNGDPASFFSTSGVDVRSVPAPKGQPRQFKTAIRIDYDFAAGAGEIVLRPRSPFDRRQQGKPTSISMWVHGDGSGATLSSRFIDGSGQTFEPRLGRVDWKGWRLVTAHLTDPHLPHAGGANDGVIHYPVKVDAAAVVGPGSAGRKGQIHLLGVYMIIEK